MIELRPTSSSSSREDKSSNAHSTSTCSKRSGAWECPGQPYYDWTAFARVTEARFGTAGFNSRACTRCIQLRPQPVSPIRDDRTSQYGIPGRSVQLDKYAQVQPP